MFLGLLGFFIVGLIVGFVASKVVNLRGDDPWLGIAGAVAGAIAGGVIYSVFLGSGVSPWDTWGVISAVVGGMAGAAIWHAVRSRYISHDSYTTRRSY
jgi:uncharacterized membrane protein YeaQ/YmgE (transglycosylase-associated protein family)